MNRDPGPRPEPRFADFRLTRGCAYRHWLIRTTSISPARSATAFVPDRRRTEPLLPRLRMARSVPQKPAAQPAWTRNVLRKIQSAVSRSDRNFFAFVSPATARAGRLLLSYPCWMIRRLHCQSRQRCRPCLRVPDRDRLANGRGGGVRRVVDGDRPARSVLLQPVEHQHVQLAAAATEAAVQRASVRRRPAGDGVLAMGVVRSAAPAAAAPLGRPAPSPVCDRAAASVVHRVYDHDPGSGPGRDTGDHERRSRGAIEDVPR